MPLITLTGNLHSTLAEASDVVLDVSVKEEPAHESCPNSEHHGSHGCGDALAVSLLERRGFRPDDFAALHPAGSLGQNFSGGTSDARGRSAARVSKDTPMPTFSMRCRPRNSA